LIFAIQKEKATRYERPKHLKVTAYGCWISPLTKFTGSHRRGPSSRAAQKHQERKAYCNANRPWRQRGETVNFHSGVSHRGTEDTEIPNDWSYFCCIKFYFSRKVAKAPRLERPLW